MFKCDCCGCCCQNLKKSPLYADLDDGTGVCKYFSRKTKLCTIYGRRPIKCNIDLMYKKKFKKHFSLKEYYALNHQACAQLKEEEKCQFHSF